MPARKTAAKRKSPLVETSSIQNGLNEIKKSLTPKTILTALAGGLLLYIGYRKKGSSIGRLASTAGSSLLTGQIAKLV